MATGYWNGGAGDGNFMTAGNWSGLGGAAPANSDTLIIGSTEQVILGGSTGLTGITLLVTAGFGGTIGSDTPLIFASAALITYAGTGNYANFGSGGTVTAAIFHHTVGEVVLSSGTWTTLTNSVGVLTIAAATVVTTLQNVAGTVTAGYNATAFTTLSNGGNVTFNRNATTLNVLRGNATQFNNGVTTFTACTTANVYNGGTYNKQSAGTDTTVNVFPGSRFTIIGQQGGSATTVTITTMNEWAGSTVIDTVPGFTATIGTRNKIGAVGTSTV